MANFVTVKLHGANPAQKTTMKIWDEQDPNGVPPTGAAVMTFLSTETFAGTNGADLHEDVEIDGTAPAATANLDMKLKVTARPDPAVGGKFLRFDVPAPKQVGEMTRHGRRLSKAEGDAIVAAWLITNNISTGYTFTRGVFRQRV
jgi:hypothetical protein